MCQRTVRVPCERASDRGAASGNHTNRSQRVGVDSCRLYSRISRTISGCKGAVGFLTTAQSTATHRSPDNTPSSVSRPARCPERRTTRGGMQTNLGPMNGWMGTGFSLIKVTLKARRRCFCLTHHLQRQTSDTQAHNSRWHLRLMWRNWRASPTALPMGLRLRKRQLSRSSTAPCWPSPTLHSG